MTVQEIKALLLEGKGEKLFSFMEELKDDRRQSVQKLLEQKRKQLKRLAKEKARIESMTSFEREYEELGMVCGIDEVGRGPLAGPVVACAVILPKGSRILWVNDSKKLSAKKREELDIVIREQALSYSFGLSSPERIDEINILQATYEAMRQAIAGLEFIPETLLNDAVTIPGVDIHQVPIIGGDGKSISIAAASILAKVMRDEMMATYDQLYPGYGFASNKGYGSPEHIDALKRLGPCPIHRKSFIKKF